MRLPFFLFFFSSTLFAEVTLDTPVTPFLNKYCFECHGGKKVKGKVDLNDLNKVKDLKKHYLLFENALDLVKHQEMPPEDELQPTEHEIEAFKHWVIETYDKNVVARAAAPQARKLSSHELHHTLSDVFGVSLEISVAKAEETIIETSLVKRVLPPDPPGESGFTNDTRHQQLNNSNWESYSYIFDFILERLFEQGNRQQLEALAGPVKSIDQWSHQNSVNLLTNVLSKIYRRPLSESEIKKALSYLDAKAPNIAAVQHELKVALMSPKFLFRGLQQEKQLGQHKVDNYELAERLSYFLWSSMPDQRLYEKAKAGKLQNEKEMKQEVHRMLQHDKSKSLSEVFANQWFTLDEIKNLGGRTPQVLSFYQQPLDFFRYLLTEDRPLLELIDSKVTYANPLIRNYYAKDAKQIPRHHKNKGVEMVFMDLTKIELNNTRHRGGLLTMPGILAMNASKNRTSPILRGTWMLERILGEHLPEPPMDVSPVPPNKKGETLTFRERFERHRNDQACSVCHNKIDPMGFALENYDAKGNVREQIEVSKGVKTKIDASGEYKGHSFQNFNELKHLLLTEFREDLIRNIVKRTMCYALCRKLELFDKPIVEAIVKKMKNQNGTYEDLIFEIVNSMSFKEIFNEEKEV